MRDEVFRRALDLCLAERAELTGQLLQLAVLEEAAGGGEVGSRRDVDDVEPERFQGLDGWQVLRELKAENEVYRRRLQEKRRVLSRQA